LKHVIFVMKDGVVYKRDGIAVDTQQISADIER
jgi:hypothetical protein